jgi:hypothetical protein
LPIPLWSEAQANEIATLGQRCSDLAYERYEIGLKLARRIPDLAADAASAKLSTTLKEWWALPDFAAFQREVKKALRADIPLKQRNEWEDEIKEGRSEINTLSVEISRLEAEINAKVYALFDLTPAEIELLEANI